MHLARGEVGVVDGVVQVGRPVIAHRLWFSYEVERGVQDRRVGKQEGYGARRF